MKKILALLLLTLVVSSNLNAQCRTVRRNFVTRNISTRVRVVIPTVIPVGIPVATLGTNLVYSYNASNSRRNPSSYLSSDLEKLANLIASKIHTPQSSNDSLIKQHCASCHSGATAKAGFNIADYAAEDAAKIFNRLTTDDPAKQMPKGKTISERDRLNLLREFSKAH